MPGENMTTRPSGDGALADEALTEAGGGSAVQGAVARNLLLRFRCRNCGKYYVSRPPGQCSCGCSDFERQVLF